jgi:maleylacetoacetate isomerase
MTVTLYSYWRSQAAYRVRIALALKGIDVAIESIDLLKGDQHSDTYRALNPGAVVPTLIDGDGSPLMESLAIIEYLDETHPNPPLLPNDPRDRAHSRAIAQMFVSDAHPFIVPRVRKHLEEVLGLDPGERLAWIRHWMDTASRAVEGLLAGDRRTGRLCCGDAPTVADLCLVPHFTSAKMLYKCDLDAFPTCKRIFDACMNIDAFSQTHPSKQPGYEAGH